jgi:glutathione S-transferase
MLNLYRVPAIEDPNTGVIMFGGLPPLCFFRPWRTTQSNVSPESGAIIQYLIEEYDSEKSLTYARYPESALVKSWLHFQMSSQGPMYGQRAWFARFHPEPLPSALARYGAEVKRVLGVIEGHLGKTEAEYLVGDKCTIADLAFVPWNHALPWTMGEGLNLESEFPRVWAWHQRLVGREIVKKVLGRKCAAGKEK